MPKVKASNNSSEDNLIDLCSFTEFWDAVKVGDVTAIDTLHFTDSHLLKQNPDGLWALHLAVMAQKDTMVRWLLLQDSPFETPGAYQWTPLHLAVRSASLAIVRYLLIAGSNTLAQDAAGWTPLHIAVSKQNLAVIKLLIISCPQVVNQADTKGWTPLHLAASGQNLDLVKLLVKEGANLEAMTTNQETPFYIAKANNYSNIATWLSTTYQRRKELNNFLKQEDKLKHLKQQCDNLQDENAHLRVKQSALTVKTTSTEYSVNSTVKTALPFTLFQDGKSLELNSSSEKEASSSLSNFSLM